MPVTINGTTGIAGVDGSAGTPAVQGADSNTGVFFPAADTVAIATGGTERVRTDSSGNVGIGTSSPSGILHTSASNGVTILESPGVSSVGLRFRTNSVDRWQIQVPSGSGDLAFYTGAAATERARIDSSGNLLVGKTTQNTSGTGVEIMPNVSNLGFGRINMCSTYNGAVNSINFSYSGSIVGYIQQTTTAVVYATSSDYRLKHDIAPMTGALARVAALKPVTYKWNVDNSDGEGFIAHELAEVAPGCVTGEKDAVDAEGNPVYQGIDTSFLVATLTAAIQEQQALIESLTARIAALEAA